MNNIYLTKQSYDGFCNPASAAVPERLTTTQYAYACKRLFVKGIKSSRTSNTGTVYIGQSSENDSAHNQFDLTANEEREFVAPDGRLIDPYDIFVDIVTAGDGVWWQASDPIQ